MKKLFLVLLLSNMLCLSSQGRDQILLDVFEVYILEIRINNPKLKKKCDFETQLYYYCKTKHCYLYEVKIEDVLIMRDSSVYKDKDSLSKVNYLIVNKKDLRKFKSISVDNTFIISAGNTTTKESVQLLNIYNNKLTLEDFRYTPTHQSGLIRCKITKSTKKGNVPKELVE